MVCGMPSSSHNKAQGILYLVHSDVCGLMSSPSLNFCLYYVIFIDDYSRKFWIYFLKAKSDTFDKFKEYKAFMENKTRKHIRILRRDNGGEFESLQFEYFCKSLGIKRQLTVQCKPQQNGVAKRKNRKICKAAKK